MLRWTVKAAGDLENIFEFIARDSQQYARITIKNIRSTAQLAVTHPLLGRALPEFGEGQARELNYRYYRIIYRPIPNGIEILTVSHSARLLR